MISLFLSLLLSPSLPPLLSLTLAHSHLLTLGLSTLFLSLSLSLTDRVDKKIKPVHSAAGRRSFAGIYYYYIRVCVTRIYYYYYLSLL